MCYRILLKKLFTSVLALMSLTSVVAQDDTKMSEGFARVSKYQLTQTDKDGETHDLKLASQSKLNWSNPVFGTTDGGLFFWTDSQSHPVVAMKTYKTSQGRWFEQVRSFSTQPVIGRTTKDGRVFWSPEDVAPPMKELPSAPVPRDTVVQRLVQMKAMHREFVVTGMIKNRPQDLRAYPRPLCRYRSSEVIDGAVMAFVQGTGPDVLLILEARKTENGEPKWYYSLGSVGIFAIDVTYGGKSVWQEPRRTAPETQPTDLYDGRRLQIQ